MTWEDGVKTQQTDILKQLIILLLERKKELH